MDVHGEEFCWALATPFGLRTDDYFIYPYPETCIGDIKLPGELADIITEVGRHVEEEAPTPPLVVIMAFSLPPDGWTEASSQDVQQALQHTPWTHGKLRIASPLDSYWPEYEGFLKESNLIPSESLVLVSDSEHPLDSQEDHSYKFGRYN